MRTAAPGVVEASQHPPTSASERFRLELVSLGEHLRQVLDAARGRGDAGGIPRSSATFARAAGLAGGGRELRRARRRGVHSLARIAPNDSSIELDDWRRSTTSPRRSPSPDAHGERSPGETASSYPARGDARRAASARVRAEPTPDPPPQPQHRAPQPQAPHCVHRRADALAVRGAARLDGIAALDSLLGDNRSLAPAPIPEDDAPRADRNAALSRTRRARSRASRFATKCGVAASIADPDALEELFDLLELARAE